MLIKWLIMLIKLLNMLISCSMYLHEHATVHPQSKTCASKTDPQINLLIELNNWLIKMINWLNKLNKWLIKLSKWFTKLIKNQTKPNHFSPL